MLTNYLSPIGYTSTDTIAPQISTSRLLLGGATDNGVGALQVANGSNLVLVGEVDYAFRVVGISTLDAGAITTSGTGILQSGIGPLNTIDIPNRQLVANDGSTVNLDWATPQKLILGLNSGNPMFIGVQGLDSTPSLAVDPGAGYLFAVGAPAILSAGVSFTVGNDAFDTNEPIEFRCSHYFFNSVTQDTFVFGYGSGSPPTTVENAILTINTSSGAVFTPHNKLDDGSGNLNIGNLTASRVVVSDGSKNLASSATTATELGYVNGVTSAIQTQLNAKQATGSYITSLTTDVVASGAGAAAATIQAGAVTLAKMANLAANSIIGNNTGSASTPIALTVSQVNTLLGTLSNPMSAVGDTIYGGTSGVATRLPGNTTATKKFLSETGSGSAATAPSWATIVEADLPQHIVGTGTAPTIAAGAGAGTSPTVAITGHDTAGQISVAAGTLPTGTNAVVVTVTFNASYGTAPYVVLYPANAATALLSGATMVYVVGGTTTFTINSGTTGITAATTYLWNYHAIG